MSIGNRLGRRLLALSLSFSVAITALSQPAIPPRRRKIRQDEKTLRVLTEKYGETLAASDLEGMRQLRDSQSPDLNARLKFYQGMFTNVRAEFVSKTDAVWKIDREYKAQTQSVPNPPTLSEVKDLAAALVAQRPRKSRSGCWRGKRPGEQLALSRAEGDCRSLVQKGDYAQALRISQLAARIAERIGDRVGLGNALMIWESSTIVRAARRRLWIAFRRASLFLKRLATRRESSYALLDIGIANDSERRFDQALEYYEKGLAISEEIGDKSFTALILNELGSLIEYAGAL